MYSPSFKRSKDNKQRVDDVWQQYKNGDITIDTVRKELLKITGGISDPDWHTTEEEGVEKPDTGIHESRGATSHPANLSRFGLRRKTPFEAKLRARIGHS
jgi:hypothetical protein